MNAEKMPGLAVSLHILQPCKLLFPGPGHSDTLAHSQSLLLG